MTRRRMWWIAAWERNKCLLDPQWDGPHQEWGIVCSWEAQRFVTRGSGWPWARLCAVVFHVPSIVVVRSGSCPDLLFEQFVFSLSCVVGNYSQVLGGFLVGLVTSVSSDSQNSRHTWAVKAICFLLKTETRMLSKLEGMLSEVPGGWDWKVSAAFMGVKIYVFPFFFFLAMYFFLTRLESLLSWQPNKPNFADMSLLSRNGP